MEKRIAGSAISPLWTAWRGTGSVTQALSTMGRVGVGEDLAQGVVGVGRTSGGGGRIDPGHRLLVDRARLIIPNGPVKDIFE